MGFPDGAIGIAVGRLGGCFLNNWRPAFTQWKELTLQLARRDIMIRYKHSMLGLYWAVLNPLLMALVFTMVFSTIMRVKVPGIPYLVFMLTGLTVWNLFGNSVTTTVQSLTGNASLLAKSYFPREILPTAGVVARLVDFGFAFLVLMFFYVIYHVHIGVAVLGLPLILIPEIMFTLGVSYLVAALNVLYRDVNQLVGLILLLWMYLSPVVYSITLVPARFYKLYLLNPMGEAVYLTQNLLLYNKWPASWHYLVFWIVSLGTLFLGLAVFKRLEPLFGEIM